MRVLFFTLLVLLFAVGLALLAQNDPGYVLIAHGPWTVESSLSLFLVLLGALFAALYFAIRFALNTLHLPGRLGRWRRERRAAKARRATARGLIALAEGHWREAEKDLTRYAEGSETALLNYLGAARAAQKLGADERRDHYLSLAHRAMPEAELAVGLTQAEVQLSHRQLEQALATLMHLRGIAPKHTHVLYLLKRLYDQLGSWQELVGLIPDLRRYKVIDEEAARALERKAHQRLLAQAATDLERLQRRWDAVPKALHHDPFLVATLAEGLLALGAGAKAESFVRETLTRHWDANLVHLYGRVPGEMPERQLAHAEEWLRDHQRNAGLLLTLGRLAIRCRLWGKARSYLEASVGADPRPETYQELGELLEQLQEREEASRCFRHGLALATAASAKPAA